MLEVYLSLSLSADSGLTPQHFRDCVFTVLIHAGSLREAVSLNRSSTVEFAAVI